MGVTWLAPILLLMVLLTSDLICYNHNHEETDHNIINRSDYSVGCYGVAVLFNERATDL